MATRKIVPRADNEGGLGTALKRWASAFIAAITCTTINALTLAAASVGFTIAGGTTSKTLTLTANTSLDEAVAMSSKLPVPGAWTIPAFNAANFTASGSMTWTVEAGDVVTYAYIILGKVMIVSFAIYTSSVGGTPSTDLIIALSESKTTPKAVYGFAQVNEDGTKVPGLCYTSPGAGQINIEKVSGNNFAISTNTTYVTGNITFEIN